MALMRGKPADMPADAIRLTETEAIHHQWDVVNEHIEESYLRPIRFGPGIMGAVGAVTGVFVNNHYRTRLRLGKFGYVGSYIPIVVLPALMSTFFHRGYVQGRILLEKDRCSLCLQTRAALVQGFFGTVYPTLLAPLAAYMYAVRHYTYRLPSVTEEPLAVLRVWRKMSRPIVPMLGISFGLNALIASYLTYREQLAYAKLQWQLRDGERRQLEAAQRTRKVASGQEHSEFQLS